MTKPLVVSRMPVTDPMVAVGSFHWCEYMTGIGFFPSAHFAMLLANAPGWITSPCESRTP